MLTATIVANADAYVDNGQPTNNYGTMGFLIIGEMYADSPNPRATMVCRAWLKFDLSSIPVGATINSAFLRLHVFYTTDDYGVETYEVVRSEDNSWTELGITNNNAPEGSLTGDTSTFQVSSGDEEIGGAGLHYAGVTSQVQAAFADSVISLRIKNEQENGSGINVSDRTYSNATLRPTLIVDYTVPRRRACTTMMAG